MVVVRKMGVNKNYKDFLVRRNHVLKALRWLQKCNPLYKHVRLSNDNIEKLPEFEFVDLPTLELDDDGQPSLGVEDEEAEDTNDEENSEEVWENQPNLQGSVLPNAGPCPMESDVIDKDLTKAASEGSHDISWPTVEEAAPIDEFSHVGYIAMAFPTLFPYGKADFLAPRSINVTPLEYFRHLMRYRGGRFAKNPRFPYFAMNSVLRWRALQTGGYYLKQHPEDKDLTWDDLVEMSSKDKNQLKKEIERFGSNLPGTSQFWKARRRELVCMIDQLRDEENIQPALFFTLSAADICWPDLHRLLPQYDNKAKAVADNPLIVDWFFYNRVQELLDTVFPVLFDMSVFWGRFEFQQRDSAHFHGLAWIKGAPDITDMECACEERREQVLKFFDKIVTTWNPGFTSDGKPAGVPHFKKNPACETYSSARKRPNRDYLGLITFCQRHTRCGKKYCLRKDRAGQVKCRFGFPKELQLSTEMVKTQTEETNEEYYELLTKRNDARLNSHNRSLLEIHRANVDVQAIVNLRMVTRYISKYVTKAEPRSDLCDLLSETVLLQMNPINPIRRIAQRHLIKTISERDYAGQETVHTLMDNKLTLSSRSFVYLRLSGNRDLNIGDRACGSEKLTLPNFVDKYCQRKKYLEKNLKTFASDHYFGRKDKNGDYTIGNHKKPAIVIATPYVPSVKTGPRYEEYCKYQLMLRIPFRKIEQLKSDFRSFSAAFEDKFPMDKPASTIQDDVDRAIANTDILEELTVVPQDPESSEDADCEDWMHLLKKRKDLRTDVVLDKAKQYDWQKSFLDNPKFASVSAWLQDVKETTAVPAQNVETINHDTLRRAQREAYDMVATHEERHSAGQKDPPLRLVVTGTAGTGKTRLILALRQMLGSSVALIAPTGVAACIITGKTIHKCLNIQVNDYTDLRGEALRQLQDELKDVRYIILDEMSVVGQHMMGMIDKRLRQAFPEMSEELLGGRSFLLVGDFGQLAPVKAVPLYRRSPPGEKTSNLAHVKEHGHMAYGTFEKCVVLDEVVRQDGDMKFRDILMRLRNWQCSDDDYALLSTRFKERVSTFEKASFHDAAHLFARKEDAETYNMDQLLVSDCPIARIKAENQCGKVAEKADADEAGGLRQFLWLRKGAKIMLTSNLWVEHGLCNGTMGTVVDVVYDSGQPPQLPAFVLCSFPSYTGPSFIDGEKHVFPVVPIERAFKSRNAECVRRMVPLSLAYAVTIHKSQGLTLDKAVVDVGSREFSAGLTFVALSRVKKMSDLLLVRFPVERIRCKPNPSLLERFEEENRLRRLAGLKPTPELEVEGLCDIPVSAEKSPILQHTLRTESVLSTSSVFCNSDAKSCYANSLLQALFILDDLCELLAQEEHPSCKEFSRLRSRRFCGEVLTADDFRRSIVARNRNYFPGPNATQNDPVELLEDFFNLSQIAEVKDLVTFDEKNVAVCPNCCVKKLLGTVDDHTILRVSKPERGRQHLQRLPAFFPEPDDVDPNTTCQSVCDNCGDNVRLRNQFEIILRPNLRYLIVHVNQWNQTSRGNLERLRGLLTATEPEHLEFFGKKFSLVAAILHRGDDPEHGHYWTVINDPDRESYLCLDDTRITEVDFNDNVLNQAHVLFFKLK